MSKGGNNPCNNCSGICCLRVSFALTGEDEANWVEYHGIRVEEIKGIYYAMIPKPCRYYKGGRCSIYKDRPQICRDYNCWEK